MFMSMVTIVTKYSCFNHRRKRLGQSREVLLSTGAVEMAEGGYDPCECICGHEHAMRRLLSFVSPQNNESTVVSLSSRFVVRSQIQMSSSQSDCTQNQCFSNCEYNIACSCIKAILGDNIFMAG